jgi:hypothetical protein
MIDYLLLVQMERPLHLAQSSQEGRLLNPCQDKFLWSMMSLAMKLCRYMIDLLSMMMRYTVNHRQDEEKKEG